MPSRRQEKVSRVVKEVVSDAINNHLNDPRIEGFISVTKVEMGTDLRNADVYLSIFGKDEKTQKRIFIAITHAKTRLQGFLAESMKSKFCPVLHLKMDEKLKKTIETFRLIDQANRELGDTDSVEQEEENPNE